MNDVMDQIIESLAFEIEAVPNENKGQMHTGLNSDPINIKIRVRNKDQNKILRQGVISIPKKDDPMYSDGKIQLSNSDQTIMSFNVLMEQDRSTKKQVRKQKRKFLFFKKGGCLGNQTEEDHYESQKKSSLDNDQLVPIKSTSINDINKRNFTLTKNYGNSETGRIGKRAQKDILGQCKPGGCLDPPYGEDKYSYVPKLIQISKPQKNSIKPKTDELEYQKPLKKNTNLNDNDEISYVFENKEESSCPTNINLLKTKYSNSIITYPSISSNELLNQDNIHKTVQYNKNNKNSKLSNNSNEIVEAFFISPKKIKMNKFQGDANSLSDLAAEKYILEKPSSQGQKNLNESESETLQNFEDTSKGSFFESKMVSQSNNENFDTLLKTQINSSSDKIVLDLTNDEFNKKDSCNNTLGVTSDTESSKGFSNPVSISTTTPRTTYKSKSDITILNTKTSGENIEDSKLGSDIFFNSETFQHDPSFLKPKLDDAMEMTYHEKECNSEENTDDVLNPLCNSKSEEIKLIDEFINNEQHSNESFIRQNKDRKEITSLDINSVIPNTSIFVKRNSSNISILNNEVLQKNEDIVKLNQDLQSPLIDTRLTSKSDFRLSNEDINKSSSFNQNDNGPDLANIYEQKLLDSKIESHISTDNISKTSLQDTNENNNSIIERIAEYKSKINNEFNEIAIHKSYPDDEADTNPTPLTAVDENKDPILTSRENDFQIGEKLDLDNFVSHDTKPDEITITSVKSDIEKSSLVTNSKETELLKKTRSSPLATRSMTSIQKDLQETYYLNNLKDIPTSEFRDNDSTNNRDTDLRDSLISDIVTNNTNSEGVETFPLENLDREDSHNKKSKSGSNDSSIKKRVKTPPLVELQLDSDKSETHNDVSMDDNKKLQENENQISTNTMSSTDEFNLPKNSKESFVKMLEKKPYNDINRSAIVNSLPEMGLKDSRVSLNLENNIKDPKNNPLNSFRKPTIEEVGNDSNKKDKHNIIRSLSKNNNLKDTIYLNMAFQSFYTENEGNVIRTIETSNNDIKRYEDDNILQFMTLARFDDSPITIPIDRDKNLLLQIVSIQGKRNQNQGMIKSESVSPKQDPKHKLVVFDKDKHGLFANSNSDKNDLRDSIKKCITNNTKNERSLQQTLDNVYNNKLLPLHNTIKNLKSDVDGLLKKQLQIKDKVHKEKVIQKHRISKNYKTCYCVEKLLMRR